MAPLEVESKEEEEELEPGPTEEDGTASLALKEQMEEQDETAPGPSGLGRVFREEERMQND